MKPTGDPYQDAARADAEQMSDADREARDKATPLVWHTDDAAAVAAGMRGDGARDARSEANAESEAAK